MERKKRYPDQDSRSLLFFKCVSVGILCMMIIQTVIITTPLYVGYRFVDTNRDNINAFTSMDGPAFVDNTTQAITNGKIATYKILDLMHRAQNLTEGNNSLAFEDIRQFLSTVEAPLKEVSELLNPRMRAMITRIMSKSMRILEKMSDNELHHLIQITDSTIKNTLTHKNVNKTMHVMDEADKIMEKMDMFLSKFTK